MLLVLGRTFPDCLKNGMTGRKDISTSLLSRQNINMALTVSEVQFHGTLGNVLDVPAQLCLSVCLQQRRENVDLLIGKTYKCY